MVVMKLKNLTPMYCFILGLSVLQIEDPTVRQSFFFWSLGIHAGQRTSYVH